MTSVHKGEPRVILFPIGSWLLLFLCILTQLTQIQFRLNVRSSPREGHWQPEEIDDAFWPPPNFPEIINKISNSIGELRAAFLQIVLESLSSVFAGYLQEKIIPSLNHSGYLCHVSCIHIRFLSLIHPSVNAMNHMPPLTQQPLWDVQASALSRDAAPFSEKCKLGSC